MPGRVNAGIYQPRAIAELDDGAWQETVTARTS